METAPASSRKSGNDEITLLELWRGVWDGRYLIIALTGVLTLIAVAYALLATEWYRASTLLAPVDNQSLADVGGQLGGLAALAGIQIGGGGRSSDEALAVLNSREFAREFITELELQQLFLDADDDQADIRDAVRFFHESVLRVSEDRDSGHVTLGVEWTDPIIASEWANTLVSRLNEEMSERASTSAQANINFLRSEMTSNNVVALEQSISRIMEAEMQKLMLARGNDEYSFRIIDHAEPPRVRSRPKRTLVVASVFVVSGMLSLLVVYIRGAFRSSDSTSQG